MEYEETMEELTLMLIYLSAFKEQDRILGENTPLQSWKGYDFDILNELTDKELIFGSRKSKSTHLSKEGIEKARKLLEKYNIKIRNEVADNHKFLEWND